MARSKLFGITLYCCEVTTTTTAATTTTTTATTTTTKRGVEVQYSGIQISLNASCNKTAGDLVPIYVESLPVGVGTQLWNDINLTTKFTFGDPPSGSYWTNINGQVYRIGVDGVIISVETCVYDCTVVATANEE